MDQNEEETASSLSNTTSPVFDCSHAPGFMWDVHDTTFPWTFAVVASIFSPAAILLNVLVILTARRRRELMRHTNTLLSSMAVADLVGGGFCIPLTAIVGLLLPHQILAERHFCLIDLVTFSFTSILFTCSLLHLTMIAWERYIAIRKWIDYKVIFTKRRAKMLAITAWISAIAGAFPDFIIHEVVRGDRQVLAVDILTIVISSVLVFMLALIVYFYVMMYLGVGKRKLSQIHQVRSVLVNATLEKKVAMTTALVTATTILSFLPITVVSVLGGFFPVFREFVAVRVAEALLYLNSVANPLIYCCRDRHFRIAALKILRVRKPKVMHFPIDDAVRFVTRGKDVFGQGKAVVQIRKVENVAGSTSCHLAM